MNTKTMLAAIATADEMDSLAGQCRQFVDSYLETADRVDMAPQLLLDVWVYNEQRVDLKVEMLYVPFNTQREKHAALYQAGQRLWSAREVPRAWFLISECWISTIAAGQPRQFILPEDDPQRMEAIMYHGMTIEGQVRHGYRPVQRDAKGHLIAGGDWMIAPCEQSRSPLLSTLLLGFAEKSGIAMLSRIHAAVGTCAGDGEVH